MSAPQDSQDKAVGDIRFARATAGAGQQNAIARAFAQHAGPLLDLTLSNPTQAAFAYPQQALVAALSKPEMLLYEAAPFGALGARQAVAKMLGCDWERVVLTASTSEAYHYLFKLLCDPGDCVAVARPGYPLFDQLARFCHVDTRSYCHYYDGEWCIDRGSLLRHLPDSLRAVILVSPGNPTGALTRRADLQWLQGLHLPIISDEVFAPYLLEPAQDGARSVLERPGRLSFSLGGLSKQAGLPQMKLGWIVVDGEPNIVRETLLRLEWIADTWLSVNAPVQVALPEILAASSVTRTAIAARLRSNLGYLRQAIVGTSATAPRIEGGWYVPLRLPALASDNDWVLRLLRDHQLKVHPGWLYDFDDGPWVVISLLCEERDFRRGIDIIVGALDSLFRD